MSEVIFVTDESGAKGYSDNKESYVGEIGLMAGILVPSAIFDDLNNQLTNIRNEFFSAEKIHITDLNVEQQSELRNSIFSTLKFFNIKCTYEACYVQGFYKYYSSLNTIRENSLKKRRSKIKINFRKSEELLHATLFEGAFGKALAYCIDEHEGIANLRIITDQTDQPILKLFNKKAEELINVQNPYITDKTGFDPIKKAVIHGTVTTTINVDEDLFSDLSKIKYSIECEDSALTLAADVLSNSLHYHLKNATRDTQEKLHSRTIIRGFVLENLIYGIQDDSFDFSDLIFKHPEIKSTEKKPCDD